MSSAILSSQQLRTIVEERWLGDPGAFAVGLHVVNGLEFPAEVESDFGKAQVVRADTVFQVREALIDAEQNQKRIVLLTKLHEPELGLDVVGRLARSKLFPVNNWASLCSLFKAKELDRSVSNSELVNALLNSAPPDGYQQLDKAVTERREKFNCLFAQELANWTSTGSTSDHLLGVENVLEGVVAKICEANNSVLLVVLDGMSWAVCQELLEDVRAEHWFEATLDEASLPPHPVIATLPSETNSLVLRYCRGRS